VQTVPETDPAVRFTALAREVGEPVRRYVARRTDPAEVDDVVAEVFLVLWRRLGEVPADDPLPWAYAVARNCLANAHRSARRRRGLVERITRVDPPRETTPAGPVDDLHPEVHEALATLRALDREVVTLWAWEGLEPREIATATGLTPNAVSIRLHRAKKALASHLGKTDDELRAWLRAADPATRASDAAAASDAVPPWIDELTEATMTQTRTRPTEPTEHGGGVMRWIPAAVAAAVIGVTAVAVATNLGEEPPEATEAGPVMTLGLPADDAMASCLRVSKESLEPMAVAFSGTATTVDETEVVLSVDHWYKGDDGSQTVQLETMGPEMVPLLGNVQFEVGQRYLVSAVDGQVTACGYSAQWNSQLADLFVQAFE
jgi:RNA polymerase sigma-70 factor (ECF subfamily)